MSGQRGSSEEAGIAKRHPHLAEVSLRLAGKLGHDFRAIDEKEEGPRLRRHRPRNGGLTGPRRAVHEHPPRRRNADRMEDLPRDGRREAEREPCT